MLKPEYEAVYTVTDFYDGPREGIANFRGTPHFYRCEFDEEHGYSDVYCLMPIDNVTFQLALEDWAIWRRWELAFHSGLTSLETHPALPEDRLRHEQLKAILTDKLKIGVNKMLRARAIFEPCSSSEASMMYLLQVRWLVID